MHRPVKAAHNTFREVSHPTKNTASGLMKMPNLMYDILIAAKASLLNSFSFFVIIKSVLL